MKVFYRPILNASQKVEEGSTAIEDLYLPREAIDGLVQSLNRTNRFLPDSARKFQDWTVGLLERY